MFISHREPLASHVFNHMKKLIASGALEHGHLLPSEAEMAKQYNVSKTVIREALTQLSAFGMVQISQGRATRVLGINSTAFKEIFMLAMEASPQGLRDAIELRRALETQTAQLAADQRETEGMSLMVESLNEMQHWKGEDELWVEIDYLFHLGMAKASGNRLMILFMEALISPIQQSMEMISAQGDLTYDRQATYQRHLHLYEAIKSGDVTASFHAVSAHFAASRHVLDAVSDDPSRLVKWNSIPVKLFN
ncbi:MAG: FadR/GntR family transcriptional regulator [Betaproteobacteria bacterium]